MKKELEDQLFAAGPTLYGQKDLPPSESCMCFGFDGIGDGWFVLLMELTKLLENRNQWLIKDGKPPVQAVQVKEKFGGLRFYTDNTTDRAYGAIAMAERMSEKTCIICGQPGELQPFGWVTCRCDKCQAEWEAQRDPEWLAKRKAAMKKDQEADASDDKTDTSTTSQLELKLPEKS